MSQKSMPNLTNQEWLMDCGEYILFQKGDSAIISEEDKASTKDLRELCHQVLWWREYLRTVSPQHLPGAATSYSNACAVLAEHIANNLISHNIDSATLLKVQE